MSTCRWCGKEFTGRWKYNPNVLCSLKCKYAETAERQRYVALTDNPMWKDGIPQKMQQARKDNGAYYVGENHPCWKGGFWTSVDGYKIIENTKEKIAEHRKIMQEHLQRKLTNNEVVHHINEVRDDNRLDNLQVMTRAEHMNCHREQILKGRGL